MKKIVFIAAVALAAAACSKTYSVGPDSQKSVGFSSWNDVMTKADKSAFAANDEIEVYGYKHNDGADAATVFNDVDVKFDGSDWTYSPIRFWDRNFSHTPPSPTPTSARRSTSPSSTSLPRWTSK